MSHGTFCWNELMAHDVEKAKAFYSKVVELGNPIGAALRHRHAVEGPADDLAVEGFRLLHVVEIGRASCRERV